ncbi:MAG: hypothetical protein ACXVIU_13295 [Halobacteriota archaeon]
MEEIIPLLKHCPESLMERGSEALIKACHDIMGNGEIAELCRSYIAAGECTCCTGWSDNFIGLAPGERAILDESDAARWTEYKKGVQCHRDPARCDGNKPLDCKMYPFFPYEVVDEGDRYRVCLGAGDHCAAKTFLTSALKGKVITKDSALPAEMHLYLAGKVGAILYNAGLGAWMKETCRLSPGSGAYNRGYVVIINKEDL